MKILKIYNYDIFEGLSLIADNSIDLVFVDPPYNLKKNIKKQQITGRKIKNI